MSDWIAAVFNSAQGVEPISLWTAIIATVGAYMTWRGLKISHLNAQVAAPHIVARNNNFNQEKCIYFNIEGPSKDQWRVEMVRVKRSSKNQLCRPEYGINDWGEQVQIAAYPQGRSFKFPTSPLVLESLPTSPVELVFTISLKSDPKIKRRCAARIEAIA